MIYFVSIYYFFLLTQTIRHEKLQTNEWDKQIIPVKNFC